MEDDFEVFFFFYNEPLLRFEPPHVKTNKASAQSDQSLPCVLSG